MGESLGLEHYLLSLGMGEVRVAVCPMKENVVCSRLSADSPQGLHPPILKDCVLTLVRDTDLLYDSPNPSGSYPVRSEFLGAALQRQLLSQPGRV